MPRATPQPRRGLWFVLLAGCASLCFSAGSGQAQPAPTEPDGGIFATPPKPASDPPPAPAAGNAHLVALLRADERGPSLIGSSGEVYEPTGEMQWQRSRAGGVSTDVRAVYRHGQSLYAVGNRSPMFKYSADSDWWAAHPLSNRGTSAVSFGPLPIISTGRHIYELGAQGWHRIASARHTIRALWAQSSKRFYVLTRGGALYVGGRTWKPIPISLAPDDRITRIAGPAGKAALVVTAQNQVFSVGARARQLTWSPELEGMQIHAVGRSGSRLLVAGQIGAEGQRRSVLAEVGKSRISKLSDLWPLAEDDHFAILHQDEQRRLLIASHFGQIRVRQADGHWKNGQVVLAPPTGPTAPPGSAPARSPAR